jgi:hypothetical protein
MTNQRLSLPDAQRADLEANNRIAIDTAGDEIIVGLTFDESNRYARYLLRPRQHHRYLPLIRGASPEETQDFLDLSMGHARAMIFWSLALHEPDCVGSITPEDAFEVGRAAGKADAATPPEKRLGRDYQLHFEKMIAGVPKTVRIAALNGWLLAVQEISTDQLRTS